MLQPPFHNIPTVPHRIVVEPVRVFHVFHALPYLKLREPEHYHYRRQGSEVCTLCKQLFNLKR